MNEVIWPSPAEVDMILDALSSSDQRVFARIGYIFGIYGLPALVSALEVLIPSVSGGACYA